MNEHHRITFCTIHLLKLSVLPSQMLRIKLLFINYSRISVFHLHIPMLDRIILNDVLILNDIPEIKLKSQVTKFLIKKIFSYNRPTGSFIINSGITINTVTEQYKDVIV